MKIMLIEDDLVMQDLLTQYLSNYNYKVRSYDKPLDALKELEINPNAYSLIVLDLMLPQLDGFDVCKKIRESSDIPIIISSARGNLGDKVVAYDYGADDFLSKPYEPRELILKINSILKRVQKKSAKREVGEFEIDENRMEIYQDSHLIEFTKVEYKIFLFLINNKDKIVSRSMIASFLGDEYSSDRAIDMHISNIRNKIFDNTKSPKYIKSVWGVGYKFLG